MSCDSKKFIVKQHGALSPFSTVSLDCLELLVHKMVELLQKRTHYATKWKLRDIDERKPTKLTCDLSIDLASSTFAESENSSCLMSSNRFANHCRSSEDYNIQLNL